MTAVALCLVLFLFTYLAGRRSPVLGSLALFASGYGYGILRANIVSPVSHFYFDAAMAGCFFALFSKGLWGRSDPTLRTWFLILVTWPCLLALLPFQTPLITLVGLRGNIFFLPLLLIGSQLSNRQVEKIAYGLCALNLVALIFALAEYSLGIERFYPVNAVTDLIYRSRDVAGGNYRLPAIFVNAHAYAGTMVATMPLIIGAWLHGSIRSSKQRMLLIAGLLAAMGGTLLAATRTNFVVAFLLLGYCLFKGGLSFRNRAILVAAGLAAAAVIATNPRMQRFESLADPETITGRLGGSVNRSFFEVMIDYPMGNGLGGGGTSIPHFLWSQMRRPTSIESEYGRILLEQGIIGFVIWLAFIGYALTAAFRAEGKGWVQGRRIALAYTCFNFLSASIGTGLMTAIPITALFLLTLGWLIATVAEEKPASHSHHYYPAAFSEVPAPLHYGHHQTYGPSIRSS